MELFTIIFLTFISSVLSLIGSFLLSLKEKWPKNFLLQMTALSSGVLLATAMLHLAPEAVEALNPELAFMVMLASIVIFFVMERIFIWHHHHEKETCCGPKPSVYLVMISDTAHNIVDGVLIAGTFLISPELGIFTAIAVAAHEIPQELADFSIMVAGGIDRKRALLFNFFSAMAAIVGAVVTYYFATQAEEIVPYILALSAGMFMYISLSDLIPELHSHNESSNKQKWLQILLFFIGILLIFLLGMFEAH